MVNFKLPAPEVDLDEQDPNAEKRIAQPKLVIEQKVKN